MQSEQVMQKLRRRKAKNRGVLPVSSKKLKELSQAHRRLVDEYYAAHDAKDDEMVKKCGKKLREAGFILPF